MASPAAGAEHFYPNSEKKKKGGGTTPRYGCRERKRRRDWLLRIYLLGWGASPCPRRLGQWLALLNTQARCAERVGIINRPEGKVAVKIGRNPGPEEGGENAWSYPLIALLMHLFCMDLFHASSPYL
jgi:hypothetical protein